MVEKRINIKNINKLLDFLGKWPSFHDSEILEAKLDRRSPSLELKLYTFLVQKEVDEKGYYKRDKECFVVIKFTSIEELRIEDLNQQNVVSGINLKQEEESIKVEIKSLYGFDAEFICKAIEVVSVEKVPK